MNVSNHTKEASESADEFALPVGTNLVKPAGVEGPVSSSEEEPDATRGVVGVQDFDGGRDLRIGDVSVINGCVLIDHMPCRINLRQLRHSEGRVGRNVAHSRPGWKPG